MNLDGADEVRQRGVSIGREFTITYRDHLESNERVIQGAFWNGPSADAEVSVEKLIAERARLHVGDTMRFDMLGRIVAARVTSIRDVEWRESSNGGFVFVFRPGVLDQAPQTFVVAAQGARGSSAHGRGSSTISSSAFRTSRSSISTRCSRPFATSCRR